MAGKIQYKTVVDDGKYTFIKREGDWKVQVLRHGEPWLEIESGSNAIVALLEHVANISEDEEVTGVFRMSQFSPE